jgi:Flp pilus assembly protein TadD
MPRMLAWLLLLAWALPCRAGMADAPVAHEVEAELSAPPVLLAALPEQATDRHLSTMARVQAIVDFMTGDAGLALRYREQPTFGIDEAYARREVNCLSFTLMFVALARASGIRAHAQASDDVVAAEVLDGMLYRTTHMNAGVEADDGRVYSVDVGWRDVLAEREPTRIGDARALALLHGNRAVEALLQGDAAGANAETGRALALDPAHASGWSNAGVVHARGGDTDAAERDYLRALELDRDHIGALGNLAALYSARGDAASAAAYGERLRRVQADDAFSQYLLGRRLAEQGASGEAIAHLRRAIRLLPRQPAFHRALAQAYRGAGDIAAALRAERRAQALEDALERRRAIRDAGRSG